MAERTVAPAAPAVAYITVFSVQLRNEPLSVLANTSLMFLNRTKGRPNQKPKVELILTSVFVEETTIHQMGTRVNNANKPHARVARLTVRRFRPYSCSGVRPLTVCPTALLAARAWINWSRGCAFEAGERLR